MADDDRIPRDVIANRSNQGYRAGNPIKAQEPVNTLGNSLSGKQCNSCEQLEQVVKENNYQPKTPASEFLSIPVLSNLFGLKQEVSRPTEEKILNLSTSCRNQNAENIKQGNAKEAEVGLKHLQAAAALTEGNKNMKGVMDNYTLSLLDYVPKDAEHQYDTDKIRNYVNKDGTIKTEGKFFGGYTYREDEKTGKFVRDPERHTLDFNVNDGVMTFPKK